MKSFKHLPTKPTFINPIDRKPYIRMQHYKSEEELFSIRKHITDENLYKYYDKRIFLGKVNTLKDLDNFVSNILLSNETFPYLYDSCVYMYMIPLMFTLKNKGIKLKSFDSFNKFTRDLLDEDLYTTLIEFGEGIKMLKILYLLDKNNYIKNFYEILNNYHFKEYFNKIVKNGKFIKNILSTYVQLKPSLLNDISFFFKKLIRQKMQPENIIEEQIKNIYISFQQLLMNNPLPKKLYRGMKFKIKNNNIIKIKGSKLNATSEDIKVSENFLPPEKENTIRLSSRKELKEKYNIDILLPKSYEKVININGEMITINIDESGIEIGYLFSFTPKSKEIVFSVLHGNYLKNFLNKIGQNYNKYDWNDVEKEWILFF